MCKGNSNDHVNYTWNGSDFAKVNQEKDLWIIISNDLKPEKHISEVVNTANKLTGFIGRAFESNAEKKVIIMCFSSLVRPRFELYAVFCRLTAVKTLKSWRECREEWQRWSPVWDVSRTRSNWWIWTCLVCRVGECEETWFKCSRWSAASITSTLTTI